VAEGKINEVDKVLQQLNQKTSELKSFQAQVEYRFIQPLLESEKLQKGDFYYAKLGNNSKLRLNFKTSQIDDEDEEKYVEEYIVFDGAGLSHPGQKFKGMWAVQIDYEMEGVRYIQLAEAGDPNKPTDVFDLINKNFPMIGFSRIEDIRKQFEITLVKQKKSGSEDFIQVHLDVKPNSVYKDDYVFIDFWIDKKTGLPAKIVTVSTEPATEPVELKDVSEIKFLNSKFNNKIAKKVFDFKIPAGFDEPEIMPLKKKDG
jgi:outer membrane lipoprotein-sorting protein